MGSNINMSIQEVKSLIEHKLDVAGVTYSNNATLNDVTYLLNSIDSSATSVSRPSYSNDVANVGGNYALYESFLKSIMSNQGFSTSADGLTGLIGNIKFSPTVVLSSSDSSPSSGDSVTVTASVSFNGNPVSGLSVVFKDGNDNTLSTGVTNNNGVCTYTFTYSSSISIHCVTTETSDYINVTSSNIEIKNYIFYDDCNSSTNLSNYSSSIPIYGANGTSTITYDNTENAYIITGTGNYFTGHMIIPLNGMTGYTIEAEFKLTNTSVIYSRGGFVVHNINATNDTMNDVYQVMGGNRVDHTPYNVNRSNGTVDIQTTSADNTNWTKLVLEIPSSGTTYNMKVYKADGTLLSDNNITGSVSADSDIQIGFVCSTERSNPSYVRNIRAYSI